MGIPRQNYSRDIYSLWSSGATVAHRIPDPKVASSNLGMCKLRLKATGLAHPLTPSLSNVFHQKSASVNFAPKSESHRQQTQPIFFFFVRITERSWMEGWCLWISNLPPLGSFRIGCRPAEFSGPRRRMAWRVVWCVCPLHNVQD